MPTSDPVLERIAAYPWPRGGVQARRISGGYSLTSACRGAPVARLKPMLSGERYEVLCWRREAWRPTGSFGVVLGLDDALAVIASEPAFWILA